MKRTSVVTGKPIYNHPEKDGFANEVFLSASGDSAALTSAKASLNKMIDKYNSELESLRSFVLPSGTAAAAHLHVARTVVRRAERRTWAAIHAFGGGVSPITAQYLNRCSDLLFVLARYSNKAIGDQLWVPGANR